VVEWETCDISSLNLADFDVQCDPRDPLKNVAREAHLVSGLTSESECTLKSSLNSIFEGDFIFNAAPILMSFP